MDTDRIMRFALKLAGMRNVTADSGIHVKGHGIKRVLVAIDVGTSELLLARELGCDACISLHFFFQAEDGIRDYKVTGVQTCALPISTVVASRKSPEEIITAPTNARSGDAVIPAATSGIPRIMQTTATPSSLRPAPFGPDRKSVV